jgi:hypothetical protein
MARGATVRERQEAAFEDKPIPGFVRVNLLPETQLDRVAARRAKLVAITLILMAMFVILGWRLYLQLQIQAAEDELLAAQAAGAAPAAELARYGEIPLLLDAAEQGQEALTLAMGSEVRWSFLLNQLSFATPGGVELVGVGGAISTDGTVETSPGEALTPQPTVGEMTFTGSAASFAGVADWLDSLGDLNEYTYPLLTDTAKESGGNSSGGVTWDSRAGLGPNALSGRYGQALPPEPAPAEGGGQ